MTITICQECETEYDKREKGELCGRVLSRTARCMDCDHEWTPPDYIISIGCPVSWCNSSHIAVIKEICEGELEEI